MIFMMGADKPVLVLFLLPEDLTLLRQGNTLWVDPRQLQGHKFEHVILSFHRTKEEVMESLRQGGRLEGKTFVIPEAKDNEGHCEGCDCITARSSLYRGKCIVCWYRLALENLGAKGN